MNKDEAVAHEKIISSYADKLGEHWDGVLILCSRHDSDGTHRIFRGSGNVFTREGMAAEYVRRAHATSHVEIQQEMEDDE